MQGKHSGRGLMNGFFLMVIGCVLIAAGLSFGGKMENFSWLPWHEKNFSVEWDSDDDDSIIRDINIQESTLPSSLRMVDIKLGAGSLLIRTAPVAGYRALDFAEGTLRFTSDETKLGVEERDWQKTLKIGKNAPKPVLEVNLPEGITLDDCRISVGAGSVSARQLAARNVSFKTGAGELDLVGCSFTDTKIETGAGQVRLEGDLSGTTEINTGAGEVKLELSGAESDYRIEFNRGLGSVKIGSRSYDGVGNGASGNPQAQRLIRINTGLGAVRISFAR